MNSCQKCLYSNIPANCQFCPACGSPLGPLSAGGPSNGYGGRQINVGQIAVDWLVSAAERMVQSRVQQGISPIGQLIQQFTGGQTAPAVPSSPPPAWYEGVYREGQPQMDPTEAALKNALTQAKTRRDGKLLDTTLRSSHASKMSSLKG